MSVPGIRVIAARNGSALHLVLINLCPSGTAASPCATPNVPITLTLGSGQPILTATATAIETSPTSGLPFADNTDTNTSAVSRQALSTTISQGGLTVTLPAFSVVEVDATE